MLNHTADSHALRIGGGGCIVCFAALLFTPRDGQVDGVDLSLHLLAFFSSSTPVGLQTHAIGEAEIAAEHAPHIGVGGWIKLLATHGFAGIDDVG